MQPLLAHRYVAEILRVGAPPVTTGELHPDWVPAVEWGYLQSVRRDGAARPAMPGRARIRPGWDHAAGAPYVSHVDVCLDRPGACAERIPLTYFAAVVQRAVAALVAEGRVAEGDEYRWRICAYPAARAAAEEPADPSFEVEEVADCARPPRDCTLATLLARAQHHGPCPEESDRLDMPVLFAPHVLQEASAAAIAAGPLEAGGILLGSLSRDAGEGELVLQVSAQVPAREAIAEDASLRFTADTWKAVHAAIRLRRDDELILGWWHSHPAAVWICRNCPRERRAVCPSNRPFFSSMDVAFHRTAFQPAHHVALLLSFLDDPAPRFDLFGWRRGLVCQRGYYTLEAH
jgi:hypothetical protein